MPRKIVEAHPVRHNGKSLWRVIVPVELNGGKQKRRYFATQKQAEAEAALLESTRRNSSRAFFRLDTALQASVIHALGLLKGREGEIVDAVSFYLSQKFKEVRAMGDAIAECIAAKKAAGCRHRYLVALANTLKRFCLGKEAIGVHEITVRECDAWINQAGISNATRRSRQIDLGTFFSFCMKRGYCVSNPTSGLERQKFDDKPPSILTVQECDTLLFWCEDQHPEMLAALALMMFAGLRPYEAYRISWEDLKDRQIILQGRHSKTRTRRIVKIGDALDAWLQRAWEIGSDLPPKDGPRRMTLVRAPILKWPQDSLRHSFVSYHYEIHGEIETAKQAGHSIDMLLRHYRALVPTTEARKFWELRP